MMRSFSLAIALATLSGLCFAQVQHAEASGSFPITPDATTTCQSTFSSGSGPSLFKFCITANGNIVQLESPAGFEHVRVGDFSEGYGICDVNANKSYVDFASSASTNWNAATRTQPNGANTFPLTIKRTTSDGLFTLTQVFSRITDERIVKVTETLKNNVPVSKPVFLVRWMDVDADNTIDNDYADHGNDSAWDYEQAGHGVMVYVSAQAVKHFANALDQTIFFVDPCTLAGSATPAFGDNTIYAGYNFTLGSTGSKTVSFEYKRF
jgi:hypothetical protein